MLLIVILLFKMTPKRSAEVLPNVPKRKKAVMCLTEKIGVLNKLRSDLSCSAVAQSSTLINKQFSTSRKRERKFADLYSRRLQKALT